MSGDDPTTRDYDPPAPADFHDEGSVSVPLRPPPAVDAVEDAEDVLALLAEEERGASPITAADGRPESLAEADDDDVLAALPPPPATATPEPDGGEAPKPEAGNTAEVPQASQVPQVYETPEAPTAENPPPPPMPDAVPPPAPEPSPAPLPANEDTDGDADEDLDVADADELPPWLWALMERGESSDEANGADFSTQTKTPPPHPAPGQAPVLSDTATEHQPAEGAATGEASSSTEESAIDGDEDLFDALPASAPQQIKLLIQTPTSPPAPTATPEPEPEPEASTETAIEGAAPPSREDFDSSDASAAPDADSMEAEAPEAEATLVNYSAVLPDETEREAVPGQDHEPSIPEEAAHEADRPPVEDAGDDAGDDGGDEDDGGFDPLADLMEGAGADDFGALFTQVEHEAGKSGIHAAVSDEEEAAADAALNHFRRGPDGGDDDEYDAPYPDPLAEDAAPPPYPRNTEAETADGGVPPASASEGDAIGTNGGTDGEAEGEKEADAAAVAVDPAALFAGMDDPDAFKFDDGMDEEMRALQAENDALDAGDASQADSDGDGDGASSGEADKQALPAPGDWRGWLAFARRQAVRGGHFIAAKIPDSLKTRVADTRERIVDTVNWGENWRFYVDVVAALVGTVSAGLIIATYWWG